MNPTLNNIKTDIYVASGTPVPYDKIYSKSGIGYLLLDSHFNIFSCNSSVETFLERDVVDLTGKSFLNFVTPDTRNRIAASLELCVRRGYIRDIPVFLEDSMRHAVPFLLSGISPTGASDEEPGLRITLKDISAEFRARSIAECSIRLLGSLDRESGRSIDLKPLLEQIRESVGCDGIGWSEMKSGGRCQCFGKWTGFQSGSEDSDFRRWAPQTWMRFMAGLSANPACEATETGAMVIRLDGVEPSSEASPKSSPQPTESAVPSVRPFTEPFGNYASLAVFPVTGSDASRFLILADRRAGFFSVPDASCIGTLMNALFRTADGRPESQQEAVPESETVLPDVPFLGILELRGGAVRRWNPWMERFLGCGAEALAGKTLAELFHPDNRSIAGGMTDSETAEPVRVKPAIDGGPVRHALGFPGRIPRTKKGDETWYWIDSPEPDDGRRQAFLAKRMELLGFLAGGIVLDFNNHLACILGYASMLGEAIPRTNPAFQDLKQILATAENSSALASRLLAFANGTPYEVRDLDVNPLVNEVAGILSKVYSRELLIRAELDPYLYRIRADAVRVQQAILEAAVNAREAMPNGGKIVFQTRNCTLNESDLRSRPGARPGAYIQIIISDTGSGMSGERKRQLSEAAGETPPEGESGLVMIRTAVESHRGFVSVFSERNKGTVVKIHLPAVTEQAAKPAAPKSGTLKGGRENVLLVETETALRDTGRKMLHRYGYQVLAVADGREAQEILRSGRRRIDLMIWDGTQPGAMLDGLAQMHPQLRILASVWPGEREAAERALRDQVQGFVLKPFHVRPLIQGIQNALNA
ncbi:PAS domain-containing protein [bacterium]|nr:PAS domain-containing protein [bacterium]